MARKVSPISRIAYALRDFLFPEPSMPGYPKEDLSTAGIPVGLGRIALAAALELSVYDEDEAAIRARWGRIFDRIDVAELPEVENRYALFTHRRSRRQYVAIRGTANRANLMHDLQFLKKTDPGLGIGAHEGFMKLARAVHEDLKPRLLPGYRIHAVGHSLGGAEAVLLGMFLAEEGLQVARIIGLGTPKVTDAEGWAAHGGLSYVSVVAPFDPVPFLPPRSLLYREKPYTHKGELLMLLDGAKAAVVPAALYDDMAAALMEACGAGKRFDVPDHQMANYLARIEAKRTGVEFVDAEKWMDHAAPVAASGGTMKLIRELIGSRNSRRPKGDGREDSV